MFILPTVFVLICVNVDQVSPPLVQPFVSLFLLPQTNQPTNKEEDASNMRMSMHRSR